MSVDDRESSMLGGFEGGAAFCIMMPVKYNVLKNIWQYAADKDKSVDNNHNVGAAQGEEPPVEEPSVEKSPNSPIDIESVASIHGVNHETRRDPKKRASKWVIIEESGRDNSAAVSTKRTKKVIWTRALHNRFLEAVRKIGFERAVPKRILHHYILDQIGERAVPKRILEIMNVPGLTRENVASHLQKYRIFLKRVMETSSHGGIIGQNISDKTLRSSFATGHPSLMINTLQQGFPQFLDRQKVGSSLLQPRFLGNLPTGNGLNLSPAIFASQKASISTNPIPQLGYGQAHSMNTKALHQQKTQPRSELVPNSMSNNTFTALGVSGANSVHGIQNSSVNNSDMTLNLSGSGQMGFAGGDMLNDFNGGYGLLDGNNSTKLASSRNENSGYFVEGASSSTRFGNTSQIPPRFSNVIQQDNNPMLLSPPMLPQLNNIGEGGEDNIYLLGQVRNISSPVDNLSIPQLAENYLHEIFVQSQPKYPSYKEKQSDGGIIRYDHGSGINQLDGNFPSFDPPYPTQQQGGAELLAHGPYNLHPESNRTWNQSADSDIMDSMFGPGMYEGGSSLPRI